MATNITDRRGYVRHSARFPVKGQVAALKAANVRVIYGEKPGDGGFDDFMASLRKGSTIVVDGLHRLGDSRNAILGALERAGDLGVTIEDARTGEKISARAAAIVADAYRIIAGDARMPTSGQARKRGEKGGRPKKERMPIREASAIWRDWVKYPRPEDALAHMPGWSKRQAYRPIKDGGLGPRGAPAGRISARSNQD